MMCLSAVASTEEAIDDSRRSANCIQAKGEDPHLQNKFNTRMIIISTIFWLKIKFSGRTGY